MSIIKTTITPAEPGYFVLNSGVVKEVLHVLPVPIIAWAHFVGRDKYAPEEGRAFTVITRAITVKGYTIHHPLQGGDVILTPHDCVQGVDGSFKTLKAWVEDEMKASGVRLFKWSVPWGLKKNEIRTLRKSRPGGLQNAPGMAFKKD